MGRSALPAAIESGRVITLADAALRLGCHVETLRLRVRRGELGATRGPHGTYYVSRSALQAIKPPQRAARRAYKLASLEWTWVALENEADHLGAGRAEADAINSVHEDPTLDGRLHRLLSVKRLRLAGLTSVEIAELLGISTRHVRRLSARHLVEALEDSPVLAERAAARAKAAARSLVENIQRRLEATGFRYHQRPWQKGDLFTPRRRAPAHKAQKLFREEFFHLRRAGLTVDEIRAIALVGIGQDELNELILRGLREEPLADSVEPTQSMTIQ